MGNREDWISNDRLKVGLFKKILTQLQETQYSGRGQKKHLTELKKLYYRQRNPEEAKDYQKIFFGFTWQAMLIPFREQKCKAQERMVSLYTKFVLTAGTEEDLEIFDFPIRGLPPFYTYFIRNYQHYHSDEHQAVRSRLTQLVLQILMEKNEDPYFQSDRTISKLKVVFAERIKDRAQTVRTIALRCMSFVLSSSTEKEIIDMVKYHAEHDPHADARKAALNALVRVPGLVKPSFIVKKTFDVNEGIRADAFKALIEIPFGNVRAQYRGRVLQWGLLQENEKIRDLVITKLIPSWVSDESCGNDLFKLLVYLDVSRNPEIAEILFRSMIPDDSEETFGTLDLNFLNADKLIPLEALTLEKVIYWRYLCNKFKNNPYCASKILPDAGSLMLYIESLVRKVQEETERAKTEDNEEEFESILCLSEILRIAELCEYEEGSRISMKSLLGKILRDVVLDDVVVIHAAVDVAHKMVAKDNFTPFIMDILLEIFNVESSIPPIRTISFDEFIPQPQDNISRIFQVNEYCGTPRVASADMESNDKVTSDSGNDPMASSSEQAVAQEGNTAIAMNEMETSIKDNEIHDEKETSIKDNEIHDDDNEPEIQSQPDPVPTKEKDIMKLKTERANVVLQRHRLIGQKDLAVKDNNFVEAQRILNLIDSLHAKEKELQHSLELLERNEVMPPPSNPVPMTPENIRMESRLISPICGPSPFARQTPRVAELRRDSIFLNNSGSDEFSNFEGLVGENTSLHLSQSLRGIVLLTRYLSWENEISPYVKMIYDTHIFECLENEESRVRIHAMYLICMVGLVDPTEARKSMAVSLQGMCKEEDRVVGRAAFKCVVDLLLQHDYTVFRMQPDDEEDLIQDLPYPLNDPNVTPEQMQLEFVKRLNFSVEDGEELKDVLLKVLAGVKLLLRGRIQNVSITSWLLDLWAHPEYTATPVCFHIGKWLPVYVSMSRERALDAVKGLIFSVREFEGTERAEDEAMEDVTKLASFVLSNVTSQDFGLLEGLTVQEEAMVTILTEINRSVDAPHVPTIAKFLKHLTIQTKLAAGMVRKLLNDITEGLQILAANQRRPLLSLFNTLKTSLDKKFGDETRGDDENSGESSDESGKCNGEVSSDGESVKVEDD